MKKLLLLLLTLVLCVSLCACGEKEEAAKNTEEALPVEQENEPVEEAVKTKEEMLEIATQLTPEDITEIEENVAKGVKYKDTYCIIRCRVDTVHVDYCELSPFYIFNGQELVGPDFIVLNAYLPTDDLVNLKEYSFVNVVGHISDVGEKTYTVTSGYGNAAQYAMGKLSSILKTLIGIDDRLCVAYSEATVYLADYQDDPLSDLFRYANAVNGIANLATANISSIDVDLLYQRFCETRKRLSEFIAISEDLLGEYKQGTHTEKLSRKQLEEIAHLLPPGDQWTTPIFDEKKDLIIRKYRLPSRKAFNRAVKVIKNHRESRAIIGDEQRLPYLTEDAIRVYRSCADYLSSCPVTESNDDLREQLNETRKKTKELRELSQELTSEQIAVFLALLDVGKFDYYSEQFDAILDYMKESNFDRMWSIRKIASNCDNIAAGLKKCGQPYFFSLLTENCTNADSANKETVHL